MLSNDTGERLVEGYERTHDAKMIAQAYGAGEWEVYHLARQMRETGSVALRTHLRGRKARLTEEDIKRIDESIQEQPDITLDEITEKLTLNISASRPGRIVREQSGYSKKKKVIHASEQERPRRTGKTYRMGGKNKDNSSGKAGIS